MSEREHPLTPPPATGPGQAWSPRVRRYMWPCEDPRIGNGDTDAPGRPSSIPLPGEWGEELRRD